jgi:hypothetical protein
VVRRDRGPSARNPAVFVERTPPPTDASVSSPSEGKRMSREKELADKIEALLTKKYGSPTTASQRLLFNEFDKDRDSKINKEELGQLLEAADVGNRFTRGIWVDGVMNNMDTDKDLKITWDEYVLAIEKAKRGGG